MRRAKSLLHVPVRGAAVAVIVALLASTVGLLVAPTPAVAYAATAPWLDGWADWAAGSQLPTKPYGLVDSTLGAQQLADLASEPDAPTIVVSETTPAVSGRPTVRMVGDDSTLLVAALLAGRASGTANRWAPVTFTGDPTYNWKIAAKKGQRLYNPACWSGACVDPDVDALLNATGSTTTPAEPGAVVLALGSEDATGIAPGQPGQTPVDPDTGFNLFDLGKSQGYVQKLLSALLNRTSNESCRVVVDLPDTFGSLQTLDPTAASKRAFRLFFNARVEYLSRTVSPPVVIARWSDLTATHPEYLDADGLRPSRAGVVARADLIRSALQRCPVGAGGGKAVPGEPRDVTLAGAAGSNVRVSWQAALSGAAATSFRVSLPVGTACPTPNTGPGPHVWTQGPFSCFQDVPGSARSLLIPESTFTTTTTSPPTAISQVAVAAIAADGMSGATASGDVRPPPETGARPHRDGGISVQLRNGKSAWFFSDPEQNGYPVATNNMAISEPGSTLLTEPVAGNDPSSTDSAANHPPLELVSRDDVASVCPSDAQHTTPGEKVTWVWITSATVIPMGDVDRIQFFYRTRCTLDATTAGQPPESNRTEHVGAGYVDYSLTSSTVPTMGNRWPVTLQPDLFTLDELFAKGATDYQRRWAQVTGQTAVTMPDHTTHLFTCGMLPLVTGPVNAPPPTSEADFGPSSCFDVRVANGGLLTRSSYQFSGGAVWGGWSWVSSVGAAAPVAMGASGAPKRELSLRYVASQQAYVLASRVDSATAVVRVKKSASPVGPFEDVGTVALDAAAGDCPIAHLPPPTGDVATCYLSQVHPELSSSRYLAVTTYESIRGQNHVSLLPIAATTPTLDRYTAITPDRLIPGNHGADPAVHLAAGQSALVQAVSFFGSPGIAGIPSDASAVALEITAVNPTAATTFTAFPFGDAVPQVATVTAPAAGANPVRQTAFVNAKIGSFGRVVVTNTSPSGTADITVDVVGWWAPSGASKLVTVPNPERTHLGTIAVAPASTVVNTTVAPAVPPTGATAVVATVTASGPAGVSGSVSAWSAGTTPVPVVATTFDVGENRTNTSILPVGTDGKLTLSASASGVNVAVIVLGWLVPTTTSGSTDVRFTTPRRIYDTHWGTTAIAAGATRRVPVAGTGTVPTDATAVLVRLTGSTSPWWTNLSVRQTGDGAPTTTNLALSQGTRTNLVLVPVGADGSITITNSTGTTHVTVDIEGFAL